MANVQYTQDMGQYGYETYAAEPLTEGVPERKSLERYTNFMGAVLSVSLLAAVGVWGYQLVMRDVSGIPVVRAAEGEMRVRPDDPGGQLALHQGLAVNEVAAAGEAAGPVDRLVLAPRAAELRQEDAPGGAAPVQQPAPLDVTVEVDDAAIDEMVATLVERAQTVEASPLAETDQNNASLPEAEAALVTVAATAVPDVVPSVDLGPGLKFSARPQLRPLKVSVAAASPVAAPSAAQSEVDAASLPVGTRLVQLGALDSPEKARAHWDKLAARFGDYMQGKDRMIMAASAGGHQFYRLRAVGFEDLADARRFCSALVAEGADCIPVVTR